MVTPTLAELMQSKPAAPAPLLTLRMRTLTPLYLGGSPVNGETPASIQSASVRGITRWWLRALVGGCVDAAGQPPSPAEVHRLESRILGTTDWSSQLRVSLTITGAEQTGIATSVTKDTHNHLYRTMQRYGQGGRGWYPPNSPVIVTIRSSNAAIGKDSSPEMMALAAALWCWTTLGTFGTRARHGFGALHFDGVNGPLAEAFADWCLGDDNGDAARVWAPPVTADGWDAFLRRGLDGAGRAVLRLAGGSSAIWQTPGAWLKRPSVATAPVPAWSCFAPGHWQLAVRTLDPPSAWWADAMEDLEERLHIHWTATGDQARVSTAVLTPGTLPPGPISLPTVEFGLPRQWSVSLPGGGAQRVWVQGRRASPLVSRPVSLAKQGQHVLEVGTLSLMFRARFPAGGLMLGTTPPRPVAPVSPLLGSVSAFLASQQAGALVALP